jgi:hypothetical protein
MRIAGQGTIGYREWGEQRPMSAGRCPADANGDPS